jgi:pimeloyl-ACP methyl ester carboxylesterase
MAEKGHDVLRFDYFGTGESGGEVEDLTLAGAIDDARTAIDEIRDLAGVRKVTVVGLRVGAMVGALASEESKTVDRLVLWDPISRGAAWNDEYVRRGTNGAADGSFETEGFLYTQALQHELEQASLDQVTRVPKNVLLVVSQPPEGHAPLRTRLEADAKRFDFVHLANEPTWTEIGDIGVGAVPADIISAIATW